MRHGFLFPVSSTKAPLKSKRPSPLSTKSIDVLEDALVKDLKRETYADIWDALTVRVEKKIPSA